MQYFATTAFADLEAHFKEPILLMAVSDVHLVHSLDQRSQLLQSLLHWAQGKKPEVFVLLGDIFDFCLGSSHYFQSKFEALGSSMQSLSQNGSRVIFVEGNHEFDMKRIPWSGVEIVEGKQRLIQLSDQSHWLIGHGDLVYSDIWYRLFRAFLKSRLVLTLARFVPGKLLDAYSLRHARFSRAADQYRSLNIEALADAAHSWLADFDADHALFGHFHYPMAHTRRDDREGWLLSFDSWYLPNALVYSGGQFWRTTWSEDQQKWLVSRLTKDLALAQLR